MSREKGTRNTPQNIIDEIVANHKANATRRELAEEYEKPYKTIKNMCTRENNKARRKEADPLSKTRGRKAAVSLQEYKYENKRLKMENKLLLEGQYPPDHNAISRFRAQLELSDFFLCLLIATASITKESLSV